MYRFAQEDLFNWYKSKSRKPLILRGARQVGKSTLVRQFSKERKLQLFEINFEERPVHSLQKDGYAVDEILAEIEYVCKKKIDPKNALIFFDEIQEQPKAINLLRYFYEKRKDLAVISAGSLLEVIINQENIKIPVGRVDFYQLGPMTYHEFLLGIGETELAQALSKQNNSKPKIPDYIHQTLNEKLKQFMIVGGMPEAVATYKESRDFDQVRRVQGQLLETYHNDFHKYATRGKIPKLDSILNYTPTHLGKKVKYVEINREFKSKELQSAIQILAETRLIYQIYFSKGMRTPLGAEVDSSVCKLYFLDVGLCSKINNISLETFNDDKFSIYLKGELAEQLAFQHLYYGHGKFENRSLYYWLNEKKNASAELDFLTEKGGKIIPIEVKSDRSTKLKSLIHFMHISGHKKAVKISLDPFAKERIKTKTSASAGDKKTAVVTFDLLVVPLYLADKIEQLLVDERV